MAQPEIDIIGTGKLASNLAPALEQAGFIINNIYGRNISFASKLAERLYQANAVDNLDFSDSKSGVYILAVSDEAIEEVAREIIVPDNAIVCHTSGSTPLSVLGYTASLNIGVFYPVQTFSTMKRVSFGDIPILIEGDNSFTSKTLSRIAGKISSQVEPASSKQRMMVHLAAVFASNFTNNMLLHASDLLKASKLDYDILAPLVAETLKKSFELGPLQAQTGPAARGDLTTLDKHMEMLDNLPEKQEIYKLISQQIIDRYSHD